MSPSQTWNEMRGDREAHFDEVSGWWYDDEWKNRIWQNEVDGHVPIKDVGQFTNGSEAPGDDPAALARVQVLLQRKRAVDGASFILDTSAEVPPVWGHGDEVLWAEGESTFIVGPSGIGKSTLVQCLVCARIGVREPKLLGLPVVQNERRVLYLAADRPRQVQRSFARMVGEGDRALLAERLVVWKGPLPFNLATTTDGLVALAAAFDVGLIVIDSLKDVALDLSKDETGSRLNAAIQLAIAEGIEVLGLHHQRKAQGGAAKPKTLSDVYGSTWITAGAGSVILLWGEAGDPVVELSHLKQPAGVVGPLSVLHEQSTGGLTTLTTIDAFALLVRASHGLSAQEIAAGISGKASPDRNTVEKARRQLEHLVASGRAHRQDGSAGGAQGGVPARYFALVSKEELAP